MTVKTPELTIKRLFRPWNKAFLWTEYWNWWPRRWKTKKRHPRKDVSMTYNYYVRALTRRISAAALASARCSKNIEAAMPRNPIISTCAGTDDKPRVEQIHLFCRGAKEEKPAGLNWWRTCKLCVRVHTTHSVGHSLRSEYQHLPYEPLKPYKPLLYIRIITPS